MRTPVAASTISSTCVPQANSKWEMKDLHLERRGCREPRSLKGEPGSDMPVSLRSRMLCPPAGRCVVPHRSAASRDSAIGSGRPSAVHADSLVEEERDCSTQKHRSEAVRFNHVQR